MHISRLLDTRNRVARVIGQLMVLIACAGYGWYLYSVHVRPNQFIRDTFRETSCFITSKKLSTKHHFFKSYRADFLVSYRTSEAQYTRWVTGNGIDQSFHRHSANEKNILSQFEIGETYLCWYDPANPHIAALVLRDYPLYSFAIPAIIGVIVLYSLFLRKIIEWWRVVAEKRAQAIARRQKRKRKRRRKKNDETSDSD